MCAAEQNSGNRVDSVLVAASPANFAASVALSGEALEMRKDGFGNLLGMALSQ